LLSFSVTPNRSDTYESQSTTQTEAFGDTTLLLYRITDDLSKNIFANGSLSWRKNMANKFSLSTDIQYSGSFQDDNTRYINRTTLGSYFGSDEERNLNQGSEQNFIYNLDFTKEFRKKETVEFGVRTATMLVGGQNNYEQFEDAAMAFQTDSNRTNNFNYLQEVAAGYFMYKQSIKKFNYGFGLRAEYTIVRGNELSRNISVEQNYFNLFPSGSITYTIGKNQQLNGSYSLRINRPRMRQLLPVGDYGDVQNIRQGNIGLKPEIIHSVEGNYNITFLKQYFSAGIFYKHILNSIAWKREFINEEISKNTFVNADVSKNLGFEIIMKNQFFKIWEITSSYNAAYIDIAQTEGKTIIRNTGWRHILKTMTNVTFWKETSLQASYNYYSPNITLQGSFHGFMTLDAGIRKMLLNKQLLVAFNVNDILNTQQFYGIGRGENFEQNFLRKRETRTYTISLNYKFGLQERKSRRDRGGMEDGGGMDMDF
jgi:outer membrane receptor protein involved in Fe transport